MTGKSITNVRGLNTFGSGLNSSLSLIRGHPKTMWTKEGRYVVLQMSTLLKKPI